MDLLCGGMKQLVQPLTPKVLNRASLSNEQLSSAVIFPRELDASLLHFLFLFALLDELFTPTTAIPNVNFQNTYREDSIIH